MTSLRFVVVKRLIVHEALREDDVPNIFRVLKMQADTDHDEIHLKILQTLLLLLQRFHTYTLSPVLLTFLCRST